jgi:hypothetical protein
MRHEVFDIGFDLVEGYALEITNYIDYLSCFCSEQILIKNDIDIYRHKERIKLASVLIVKV